MRTETANTEVFENRRIDSIQALRGIAAMAVVVGHSAIFTRGTFGVDIFFVVSGFIMMYVTQSSAKHFLVKRLIRIVPLYWLVTAARFALSPSPIYSQPFNWTLFVESLLFFPDFKFHNSQPIFNVGWTLNHEMAFYLLFTAACAVSIKNRGIIVSAFLIIWTTVIRIFELPYFYPTLPLEFILGILSFEIIKYAYICKEKKKTKFKTAAVNMVCIALCILSLWFMMSDHIVKIIYLSGDWKHIRPLALGVPAMILACSFCVFMKDKKVPKIVSFFGNISFSCYLLHVYVIAFTNLILINLNLISASHDYFEMTFPNVLFMIFTVSVSVAISWLSYQAIELRFTSWLRKRLLQPHIDKIDCIENRIVKIEGRIDQIEDKIN